MTGPEHYRKAEQWLYKAENAGARGGGETAESCAAIAQAHATLAGVAAGLQHAYPVPWDEVIRK